jgi:hypothetical protein
LAGGCRERESDLDVAVLTVPEAVFVRVRVVGFAGLAIVDACGWARKDDTGGDGGALRRTADSEMSLRRSLPLGDGIKRI